MEMMKQLFDLSRKEVYEELAKSGFLSLLSRYIREYPWNNFLQLRTINIFTNVLERGGDVRLDLLKSSRIGETIVELASAANVNYVHASQNKFR